MTKEKERLLPFLTRHVPSQISNTQKLCYRHRPDLVKNRGPDDFDFQKIQDVSFLLFFLRTHIKKELLTKLSILNSKWKP